jgi:mitogen-activated protein kinase 1/3
LNPNSAISSSKKQDSLGYKLAKWTRKVSGISCGASLAAQPSMDEVPEHRQSGDIDERASLPVHSAVSTKARVDNLMQEKGHRKLRPSSKKIDDYEQDHHTFATAPTASATCSYSTDQGDANSVVSEIGMEVVMNAHIDSRDDITSTTMEDTVTFAQPYRSHSFPAGKHTFTVDQRYSLIRTVGSGAYGVVISAKDAVTDVDVAIKMVPKAFSDEIDAKRILREIKLLKHFRHENIVRIVDMMPPSVPYLEDFSNVYIVADLMETDLHRIIYSKQKLSIDHVQYFIYQVLRGLKYIHSCKVLHRDLKPSNLLVNSNCDLKICDFGLARGIHDPEEGRGGTMMLTEYVVTRWYRAPEIMLACHEYSYPIDVWSVGCIFAELILRKPFFPGDDYIDQLTIIARKLGKLPDSDLDFVTSDKAKRFMRKLPSTTPVSLSEQFPGTSPEPLDAMHKMMDIHPRRRSTVEQALKHTFFEPLHNPEDEPVSSRPFDFSFEKEKLRRIRLQELIWEEVGDFRPSSLPVAPRRNADP